MFARCEDWCCRASQYVAFGAVCGCIDKGSMWSAEIVAVWDGAADGGGGFGGVVGGQTRVMCWQHQVNCLREMQPERKLCSGFFAMNSGCVWRY